MNFCKLFFLALLLFCSCNFKSNEIETVLTSIELDSANNIIQSSQLDYLVIDDSIITKINEGHPQLSYKFNIDTTGFILKSIVVYSDLIKVQEIIANKNIYSKDFQLVDWNFDGYNDISVLDNCGSGGCAYWIWNYSPKTSKYYYNQELSEVLGLEIDNKSKFIVFHYRAGYSEENWDSFQYKNNKLTFVKGVYQERWNDSLGNFWIKRTHTKMINNKIFTIVDSSMIKEN